jgi:hypothetical protein
LNLDIPGADPVVLRPWPLLGLGSWLTPLGLLGIVAPLIAADVVVVWLSGYPLLDPKGIALIVLPWAVVGLPAVYLWLYFRNTRIEVRPLDLRLIGPFGGTRTVSGPDIDELHLISLLAGRGQAQPVGLILDRDGRCLARINPGFDLEALARALGREISDSLDERLTWQEARRRFPGSVPYSPSRTIGILFGLGLGLAVLVAFALRVLL